MLLSPSLLLAVLASLCAPQGDVVPPEIPVSEAAQAPDAPLDAFRVKLLEQAWQAVSGMPDVPHLKNRSRSEEVIALTCLELGQLERAEILARRIGNWRQGLVLAHLAECYQGKGQEQRAQALCTEAETISAGTTEMPVEGWRRDRIRAKVAQVRMMIEPNQAVLADTSDLELSEAGPVLAGAALTLKPEQVRAFLADVRKLPATGSLESVQNGLFAALELYREHYADAELRAEVEAAMRSCWLHVPGLVRMQLVRELTRCAVAHNDQKGAERLLGDAYAMMDGMSWQPRYHVPAMAETARLAFEVGKSEQASTELKAALEMFQKGREGIVNIYRTESLLPVAEAQVAVGDRSGALATYRLAVEESQVNPNSRPRSMDLAAILCSMARTATEPDEALAERIDKIIGALGDPW
ncbi:MAG: hypothetical protein R3F33_00890 [Planctomycetota bacterium]